MPNLERLVELYTELSNVFKVELYGEESTANLKIFDINNFKNILFRSRESLILPSNFVDLLNVIKSSAQILHFGKTSKKTIVFNVDDELIKSFTEFHEFMENLVRETSNEIVFKYEIIKKIINDKTYCGIPWVKLYYKNKYLAYYNLTERKRLFVGKNFPDKKQVAAIEIFEVNKIQEFKSQIISELKDTINEIDMKTI